MNISDILYDIYSYWTAACQDEVCSVTSLCSFCSNWLCFLHVVDYTLKHLLKDFPKEQIYELEIEVCVHHIGAIDSKY
jgi:hypothetical protein